MKVNKEVRQVLIQYRNVYDILEDINQQINNADTKMCSIKSGNISGMPRGGEPITLADLVIEKDELITRKLRFEKMAQQKKEIVQAYIDTVFILKYNKILTDYFIKQLTIEEISRKYNYSRNYAFKMYCNALNHVDLSINL